MPSAFPGIRMRELVFEILSCTAEKRDGAGLGSERPAVLSVRRTVPSSARAVLLNLAEQFWLPGRAQPFRHRFSLRPSAETLPNRREPQSEAQKPRRGLRARMSPLEFPNRRRICASGRSRAGKRVRPRHRPDLRARPGKRGGGGRSSTAGESVPSERPLPSLAGTIPSRGAALPGPGAVWFW